MSDTPTPAGYQITRELDEGEETEPHCITCVERDGLLVWDHEPITREVAEHDMLKCDACGQLLIVDYLQRQIDEQDWRALKQLKEKTAPFYYQYVELKRKR